MNRIFILFIILTIPFLSNAQVDLNDSNSKKPILRASILIPAVFLEQPLNSRVTLLGGIKFGFTYTVNEFNSGKSSELEINPFYYLESRYYTTLKKREKKGKQTQYFSSGYFGLPFAKSVNSSDYSLGLLYGFQNTLGKKGFWNIGLGCGYNYNNEEGSTGVIADLGIGFILN